MLPYELAKSLAAFRAFDLVSYENFRCGPQSLPRSDTSLPTGDRSAGYFP